MTIDVDPFEDSEPLPSRPYYAQRQGAISGRLDLETACRLFRSTVSALQAEYYFQEWAGYECVDAGTVLGSGGSDLAAYAFRKTRMLEMWPPTDAWDNWNELQLLTAVEFFHDIVSKPVAGRYHGYGNCGYHASRFDRDAGQRRYRIELNDFLGDVVDGYELEPNGEVVRSAPDGLDTLLAARLPASADEAAAAAVAHAIRTFRGKASTELDQRDAIKSLADVLESIRPRLKAVFAHKDEDDLFHVANGFNLRHKNAAQQSQYDADIFLPWLFYSFLAAVHAAFKLIDRGSVKP